MYVYQSIVSPLNEVHIYSDSNQLKFIGNNKSLIKLKENKLVSQLLNAKLLYIELTNQLMIFGASYRDQIYFCNVNDNNQTNYKWQLYSKKLHYKCSAEKYDVILAFKHLIFVFYRDIYNKEKQNIYCLDLLNNNSWYKSTYQIPWSCIRCNLVKSVNNFIYFIPAYGTRKKKYFKVSLYDLIPESITKFYQKHYELLVFGYIKQFETTISNPNIPITLMKLIANYYPSFI